MRHCPNLTTRVREKATINSLILILFLEHKLRLGSKWMGRNNISKWAIHDRNECQMCLKSLKIDTKHIISMENRTRM